MLARNRGPLQPLLRENWVNPFGQAKLESPKPYVDTKLESMVIGAGCYIGACRTNSGPVT